MASLVILLSSGPTVMNASSVMSRAISAIWLVANCVTATLSALTPGFGEDHAEQGDVGLRPADDADAVSGEFVERLDLGRRLLLRTFRRQAGRRPEHDDVLAQDDDRFAHWPGRFKIAARNREIGLARGEQRDALRRALGRIGVRRIELPSRAKIWASVWTSFWSSLPGGPTAIRKVVGRRNR